MKRKTSTVQTLRSDEKQSLIENFLSSDHLPTQSKKKKSQLKMDLYVKWKDPERLKRAEIEREESFRPTKKQSPDNVIQIDEDSNDSVKKENSQALHSIFAPKPNIKKSLSQEIDDDFIPAKLMKPSNSFKKLQEVQGISLDEIKTEKKVNLNEVKKPRKDVDRERRRILKSLIGENFVENQKHGNTEKIKQELRAELKEGDVIRKKEQRNLMHGTDCSCCAGYYDALDLSPDSKAKRIQQVSRHKYINNPMPRTPEHYWDVGFPSESEQKKRGLIKYTSPKNKMVSKKLF